MSVVIVSWNTRSLLRDCLNSLAAGRVSGNLQVVVVDNASVDGTVEAIRQEYPWVTILANERNRGFAAATNQGIEVSTGRFILLLNPDTRVDAGAIDQMVLFMEQQPDAAGVGPRVLGGDGELQESCFPAPTLAREVWRLFHLERFSRRATYPLAAWSKSDPRSVEVVQGACLLIRRSVIDSIGPLDERFYIYTEEVDLCRRATDAGWKWYWLPDASIVHLGGQSTRQVAEQMFLELYGSKIQYFRKHAGVSGAGLYKLVLAAAAVSRIVVSSLLVACYPQRRLEFRSLLRNYLLLLTRLPAIDSSRHLQTRNPSARRP